jgi:glycosyltransferase involved in cell wall biosynthesis
MRLASVPTMWHARTVSVVLMTYAEKDSIRTTIEGFLATGVVDEVVVVDNNAEPGTREEVARTQARVVHEPRQGYGFATRRGLAEATGDLIVLCEPDGTFMADDIFKLLVYSDDCDVVFGTRTTRELLWQGANMGFLLKWGNWALAKVIEVLFNTSHLSDVGCTYRLLRREALGQVEPRFTVGSQHFGPELMLLCITSGLRTVEVPVNYLPRVGVSSVTGSRGKAFRLGVRMGIFILGFRLRTLGRRQRVDWKIGGGAGAVSLAPPAGSAPASAAPEPAAGPSDATASEGGSAHDSDEDFLGAGSSA